MSAPLDIDGWNYRVIRFTKNTVAGEWFEVREVYYDSTGKPIGYTKGASGPCGDTLDELNATHVLIGQAATRPIINAADFPDGDEPDETPRDGEVRE